MDKNKLMFRISTGLLTLMTFGAAGTYIFNHQFVADAFTSLGYPTYLIYPLAVLKILGISVIWLRKPKFLINLAYSGFFWDYILAFFAHIAVGDGEFGAALVCFILLTISYIGKQRLEADS